MQHKSQTIIVPCVLLLLALTVVLSTAAPQAPPPDSEQLPWKIQTLTVPTQKTPAPHDKVKEEAPKEVSATSKPLPELPIKEGGEPKPVDVEGDSTTPIWDDDDLKTLFGPYQNSTNPLLSSVASMFLDITALLSDMAMNSVEIRDIVDKLGAILPRPDAPKLVELLVYFFISNDIFSSLQKEQSEATYFQMKNKLKEEVFLQNKLLSENFGKKFSVIPISTFERSIKFAKEQLANMSPIDHENILTTLQPGCSVLFQYDSVYDHDALIAEYLNYQPDKEMKGISADLNLSKAQSAWKKLGDLMAPKLSGDLSGVTSPPPEANVQEAFFEFFQAVMIFYNSWNGDKIEIVLEGTSVNALVQIFEYIEKIRNESHKMVALFDTYMTERKEECTKSIRENGSALEQKIRELNKAFTANGVVGKMLVFFYKMMVWLSTVDNEDLKVDNGQDLSSHIQSLKEIEAPKVGEVLEPLFVLLKQLFLEMWVKQFNKDANSPLKGGFIVGPMIKFLEEQVNAKKAKIDKKTKELEALEKLLEKYRNME
eukprot:Nk52_evm24s216 gene=Nk52_evmTU24s216